MIYDLTAVTRQYEKESALSAWRKILKIEEKSINNYSEQQDHSLIILKIVNRFRQLGYLIDDKDLLQYQKTEQQAKFLITSLKLLNAVKAGNFLIPIHAKGNYTPLFAFPDLLLYCNIGYHLSKNQPFYSIERSLCENDEDIVAHYISEIKKVHPHGPYNLIGFCKMGEIALKMAHTLIAQGEEVPLLVLIEYYSPKADLPRTSMRFISSKTKFIYDTLKKNIPNEKKGRFILMETSYAFNFFYKKSAKLFQWKKHVPAVKTYSGKVVLFRASETDGVKDDPYMGWSDHFTGGVESFKIKSDHLDIMLEPGASELAEKLNAVLEKANKKYPSKLVPIHMAADNKLSIKAY
jgi:thioesterase domain-containing protein